MKCGEKARPRFYQRHPGQARVDRAKVGRQRLAREFRDGARHFDSRRAAADDDEAQQPLARRGVVLDLSLFEGQQYAPANQRRVVDAFESGGVSRPIVVRKVAVRRPGRYDQAIVRDPPILSIDDPAHAIDGIDIGKNDGRVGLFAQYAADRRSDVGGREACGRHLIQKRLKQVVIVPIDHDDVGRRLRERLGSRQSAETCADDGDTLAAPGGVSVACSMRRRFAIRRARRSLAWRPVERGARRGGPIRAFQAIAEAGRRQRSRRHISLLENEPQGRERKACARRFAAIRLIVRLGSTRR